MKILPFTVAVLATVVLFICLLAEPSMGDRIQLHSKAAPVFPEWTRAHADGRQEQVEPYVLPRTGLDQPQPDAIDVMAVSNNALLSNSVHEVVAASSQVEDCRDLSEVWPLLKAAADGQYIPEVGAVSQARRAAMAKAEQHCGQALSDPMTSERVAHQLDQRLRSIGMDMSSVYRSVMEAAALGQPLNDNNIETLLNSGRRRDVIVAVAALADSWKGDPDLSVTADGKRLMSAAGHYLGQEFLRDRGHLDTHVQEECLLFDRCRQEPMPPELRPFKNYLARVIADRKFQKFNVSRS